MRKQTGFTLIELLVVVLIIGILAAVALPQYQLAVARSRFAAIQPLLADIKAAEEVYYLANGAYTATENGLDLSFSPDLQKRSNGMLTKDFSINLLGDNPGSHFVDVIYCPGGETREVCLTQREYKYWVWFANSNKPNVRQCEGYTKLGKRFCKRLQ